jgi:hypothetical protein
MLQSNDLSRSSAALDQDSTLIAVIEMSQASWLVGAIAKAPYRSGGCWIKPIGVAVIAALVTGELHVVNWSSSSPRIAIAQETEDVYDTVSGRFCPSRRARG